jgi:flagellar biosynthetic protein FliR
MISLLDHVGPFCLTLFRLSGVFLVAPILASTMIPATARALLVAALAAAIYPTLPAVQQKPIDLDLLTLGWAVAGETLVGFCIGLLMMMPLAAVQLSGLLMGHQMGFGLAQVYNPALEADTDILGDLLSYIALGVFLAIGGLESLFLATARTFSAVPLGSVITSGADAGTLAPVELLAGVLAAGFELAVRVSLPVMGIILIETLAVAFLSKTMPQLNIMSIGFAIKIVLGLGAIVAGLTSMHTAIADHVGEVARAVLGWSEHPLSAPIP